MRTLNTRRKRYIALGLVVIGVLLVLFFGLRTVRHYIRIQQYGLQPGVTNVENIRGWMTIPYIARAYHVPEDYIFEQLDIPIEPNRRHSLRRLNRDYAPGEPGALVEAVKTAIEQYQQEESP